MSEQAIVVNRKDSVAVALEDLAAEQQCSIAIGSDTKVMETREKIPFGHKFALKFITKGEEVVKYGEVIGEATADIEPGAWVHVHNLVSKRGKGQGAR